MPARSAQPSDLRSASPVAASRKVVQLIAPLPVGGAESVVRALAAGMHRSGRDVEVVALVEDSGAHAFVTRMRNDGVAVTAVACGRRRYLAEVREVTRLLRRAGATLLHTHLNHADVVGYLAARRCGIPVVATVHGFTGSGWKNRAYIWLDMRLIHRFDAVICVAGNVRDRVLGEGCDPDRVHLVPNGYALLAAVARNQARAKLGLTAAGQVVGWVGRLTWEKGADLLIQAMGRLRMPQVTAVLVGAGADQECAIAQAASHNPASVVRFVGQVDDASSLLSAFDVLAISSRTEATPMVLLEAMASGVPVVAFAVGGIPSVLDNRSAWLVPPGDTGAFAGALQEALQDPAEAARRTAAARETLRARYGLDRWIQQVETVYDRVTRS